MQHFLSCFLLLPHVPFSYVDYANCWATIRLSVSLNAIAMVLPKVKLTGKATCVYTKLVSQAICYPYSYFICSPYLL